MQVLTFLFLTQVNLEWQTPITLNTPALPMERVTVAANRILIPNETEQVVYVLDMQGNQIARLGGGEAEQQILVPYQASWIPSQNAFYVYDAGARRFSVWGVDGSFKKSIPTEFDYFFEIGRLLPVNEGYVAPISLTANRYLLGFYDRQFNRLKVEYPLELPALKNLSPSLRETFITQVESKKGPLILAIQSLARSVAAYDRALNPVDRFTLNVKGWREVDLDQLEKVSKNPKMLRQYKRSFTQVHALEALFENAFIVGIQNLSDPETYTYQFFAVDNGLPIANQLESPYQLIAAWENLLFFVDPGSERMALIPCRVYR